MKELILTDPTHQQNKNMFPYNNVKLWLLGKNCVQYWELSNISANVTLIYDRFVEMMKMIKSPNQ
jgi:hypothetical protein